LVNLDGEVIGINCMKAQGHDGISFAIPIDTAVHVIDQLIRSKKVVRPFVGLKMLNFVETDPAEARKAQRGGFPGKQPDSTAVLIVDVVTGSPADLAGLRR
jgi:HtrA serine peptidase 2